MKQQPQAVGGNPFRIYKRGDRLRKHSQYEERKFYLSRIMLAAVEPDKPKQSRTHRNILSEDKYFSKELGKTVEPLRNVMSRHLYDASEQIRKRRQFFWKQYHLDEIDLTERRELVKTAQHRSRSIQAPGSQELRSRYTMLLKRSPFGVFR